MKSLILIALLCGGLPLLAQQSGGGLLDQQDLTAYLTTETNAKRADERLIGAVKLAASNVGSTAELTLDGHFSFKTEDLKQNSTPSGAQTVSGHLEGKPGGYFILAQSGGVLSGKIEVGDGTIYLLRPGQRDATTSGVYATVAGNIDEACQERKATKPPRDNNKSLNPGGHTKADNICNTSVTCNTQVIRVMMVYTNAVETELGSAAAVTAAFNTAVEEANMATANSGLDHRFELTLIQKVNYTESDNLFTDLDNLESSYDGEMDEIHEIRSKNYVDLVAMIVSTGGCGLGNVNVDPDQYDAGSAFSVTGLSCMLTNKSLAHEMGHNIGFQHDRPNVQATDFKCDDEFGWVNPTALNGGATSTRWRTIMAYNNQCRDSGNFNCSRVLQWSNPNINFRGEPTGSPRGTGNAANNAGIFQQAACQVADFRVRPCDDCTVYQDCANLNSNTANGPGNRTRLQITDAPTSVPNGAEVELCLTLYGDFSGESERVNVIGEDGTTLGATNVGLDCDIPTRTCFTLNTATANNWLANGTVTINLDPRTSNINPRLCRTVNEACAELTVSGASPSSAILEEAGFTVDDDNNTSSGNNNGEVNPGETIELPVFLRNNGGATATGVSATLTTDDAYVTNFTDSFEEWGDIPPGQRVKCVYDYDFTVTANSPSHDILFTLAITSNQGSWTETFTVPIVAADGPALAFSSFEVDDDNSTSSGNDNGAVNPGETIELPVILRNSGNRTATGVSARLTTNNGSITNISDGFEEWPDIPAGTTRRCVYDFDFEVATNAPSQNVTFTLAISSDQGNWTETFTVPVSSMALDEPTNPQVTASDEPTKETDLSVFPNPASNRVWVVNTLTEPTPFTVTTLTGQVIKTGLLFPAGKLPIEIGNWPSGVYLLNAQTDRQQLIKRIVVR